MSKATGVKGKTPDQLRRAEDAVTRQAERDKLTAEVQLTKLWSRPGESVQERQRLMETLGQVI